MLNKVIVIALSIGLFACANVDTTSQVNCDGDWKIIGFETAEAGKSVRTFDQYLVACGKKAEIAKSDYLDGYTKGIIGYCSKDNGFAIGFKNLDMPQVCPYELRSEFTSGYELGRKEYKSKVAQFDKLAEQYERDRDNSIFNDFLSKENARLAEQKR